MPDWLAVALLFWNVHQPRRVGIGASFVFGLLMDVHNGALFGEHALAYTLISYGRHHAASAHDLVPHRCPGVLPLLLVAQVASLAVRMWVGGNWPGFVYFAESLVGTALWPVISWLLLAPQRRPTERDDTRPL